mmetsp:Transcript_37217/g.97468  ORF Transcript_37217/g.97468 Transcript_37217/m.97468 type:complete len:211 (-) Transcript_37217:224-856(-)
MVGLVVVFVVGAALKRHSSPLRLRSRRSRVRLPIALCGVRLVVGLVGRGPLEGLLRGPLPRLRRGLEGLLVVPTVEPPVVRLVAGFSSKWSLRRGLGRGQQPVLQRLTVGFSPELRVVLSCRAQWDLLLLRWWRPFLGKGAHVCSFVPRGVVRLVRRASGERHLLCLSTLGRRWSQCTTVGFDRMSREIRLALAFERNTGPCLPTLVLPA